MSANAQSPVDAFWQLARFHAKLNTAPSYFGPTPLEVVPPPAWSFGDSPEDDRVLALVLEGTKTATTSSLADYEAEGEALPEPGTLSILVDSSGHPRALLVTTEVRVARFEEVDEEHARLEGEGDGSLAAWRAAQAALLASDGGDATDLPVVLERFEVVYQEA
jgi:uncharacterized protein YhfF